MSIEITVPADDVCGKCSVICGEDIEGDIDKYHGEDPNRFYFMEVSKKRVQYITIVTILELDTSACEFSILVILHVFETFNIIYMYMYMQDIEEQ